MQVIILTILLIILLLITGYFVYLLLHKYLFGEIVITLMKKDAGNNVLLLSKEELKQVTLYINGKAKKLEKNPVKISNLRNGRYEILVRTKDERYTKIEKELEKIEFVSLVLENDWLDKK